MRILSFPTLQSVFAPDETIRGRFAVVIDTLRATSVIATAFASGAKLIIPFAEVEEAQASYKEFTRSEALLCGERGGRPIPGFHLGNSPLEFTPQAVGGKTLVMTTTNGTRAIRTAAGAARLALGALVNASCVAQAARVSGMDITIVCAGTEGFFTLEDVLTAGAIIDALGESGIDMDDLSRVALKLYRQNATDLLGALKDCTHAKRLAGIGYGKDLEYCMKKDLLSVVPYYEDGRIVLSK